MMSSLREGIQIKKTFLNGQRATGNVVLFFRPSKTTFKRVLRNQIPIENDRENDEYDDENGDNFDVWWWQCPKIFNYHDFVVKIYPF